MENENKVTTVVAEPAEDEVTVDASVETDKAVPELEEAIDILPEVEVRDDVLVGPANPAEVKRERKGVLPSANVDPVEKADDVLTAESVARPVQAHEQHSVASIIKDAPDGAIVKCRYEKDRYAVFSAAAKAGKELKVVHKPNQEARIIWRIPG